MPQLDIIYIFTVYLWAWFILCLITRKIKTYSITTAPPADTTTACPTVRLPWT
uniref:ATP synthase F0 subunit 8 n=1 Tax=Pareas boulengeri TaxID=1090948 RepID=A0A7H1KJQ9_9SAUR|nr:ATP synthase F0 subunit 8 [Pareas boulengeri]QNT27525.1 ATP synthase F0 subunit 8 [Pareas boulengeri]